MANSQPARSIPIPIKSHPNLYENWREANGDLAKLVWTRATPDCPPFYKEIQNELISPYGQVGCTRYIPIQPHLGPVPNKKDNQRTVS